MGRNWFGNLNKKQNETEQDLSCGIDGDLFAVADGFVKCEVDKYFPLKPKIRWFFGPIAEVLKDGAFYRIDRDGAVLWFSIVLVYKLSFLNVFFIFLIRGIIKFK